MSEHDPLLPIDPDAAPSPEPVWDIALAVALGGAVGGGLRYLLNVALSGPETAFPWSTFIENVVGCFLLGVLMVFVLEVWSPTRYVRPFLGVGVLGGFTTFSAYTVDTHRLLAAGEVPLGMAYLFGSVAVGLAASWAGIQLTRRLAT